MLKRKLLSVLVATAAVGFGGFAMNAGASDGTGNASATIVAPIAITEAAGGDMDFGSVSGDSDVANSSTVVLSTAGAVTASVNAAVVPLTGAQAATFDVTGAANALYDIVLPSAAVTISNGTDNMTVDTFVGSLGASGTLSAGGTESFNVGATLNIAGNQPTGTYTGTYTVTVTYQ